MTNEDRAACDALRKELTEFYRPLNQITTGIVQDIATAHWQIGRLDRCLVTQWNLAIAGGANTVPKLTASINRQIDQLQLRIARLERRIKFVHVNFPAARAETKTQINEPTVQSSEKDPGVSKSCRIFVMPPPMPPPKASTPKPTCHPLLEKHLKRTPA